MLSYEPAVSSSSETPVLQSMIYVNPAPPMVFALECAFSIGVMSVIMLRLDTEAHVLDLVHLRRVDPVVERHVRRLRSRIRHPHVGQRDRIVLIRDIRRVRGGDAPEQCACGHGQRRHGLSETPHDIPPPGLPGFSSKDDRQPRLHTLETLAPRGLILAASGHAACARSRCCAMTMAYGIIHKVLLRGPERPWRHGNDRADDTNDCRSGHPPKPVVSLPDQGPAKRWNFNV